jgi:Bifunctional DNA primase/polymerase, N-terminal
MSDRQDAAVRYASAGWPVFPVAADKPGCDRGPGCRCKAPLTAHGMKDAETDPGTVARYWARHPDANIGVATGRPGPDVLDIDVSDGKPGPKSLNEAHRAGLIPVAEAYVRTGSGGFHLFYRGDDQRSGSLPQHGIDWRGAGGYIVAAPSMVHGRPYVVLHHGGEPASIDFAAIREHFQPESQRSAFVPREGQPLGHLVQMIAGLPDGQGRGANGKTFWALCRALENGDAGTADEIERAAISRGLTPRAVRATRLSAERTVGHNAARQASPKAGPDREAG